MDVGPSLLPAFPLQTVVCFKLLQNKIFLVSFIIKVTVSAPCEPCMSCNVYHAGLLHYSVMFMQNFFSTNKLID